MAYMQCAQSITLPVALATAISQYRFVTINASGQAALPTANGNAVGVSLDSSSATQDKALPVAILNGAIIKVTAGAAVSAGDLVATDGQGRAVEATGNATRCLGICKEGVSTAGEVITIIAGIPGFAANA